MRLEEGRLKLTPRGDERIPHPIDYLFTSLAREKQSWAIGVVLSGTGSDGAAGLREIKGAGGLTFAQDQTSAKFSGMPLHAAHDAVDFILPPDRIAQELIRIGKDPYLALTPKTEKEEIATADLKHFRRILGILRSGKGLDLTQYRDTTIRRRIQRRMVIRTRQSLQDYADLLEKEPGELNALFNDVLINVTSFFRDPEMFEALKKRVLPELVKNNPDSLRVWVAGCSTGQEAYSIAITLLEFFDQKPKPSSIQIFATDISESVAIEAGRRGFYPDSIEAEVSPVQLRRFFVKDTGGYRVSKEIRDLCILPNRI
nr:chemotaxis protein methyltransferase CheR [uncultured bacterium]